MIRVSASALPPRARSFSGGDAGARAGAGAAAGGVGAAGVGSKGECRFAVLVALRRVNESAGSMLAPPLQQASGTRDMRLAIVLGSAIEGATSHCF